MQKEIKKVKLDQT